VVVLKIVPKKLLAVVNVEDEEENAVDVVVVVAAAEAVAAANHLAEAEEVKVVAEEVEEEAKVAEEAKGKVHKNQIGPANHVEPWFLDLNHPASNVVLRKVDRHLLIRKVAAPLSP
tara:strand:+ start:215 stop:562 length:348 start_codon:yes stop_codon:yes gene_type:complete